MLIDKFPWLLQPSLITILIRTVLAVICGGAIGYDRNLRGASAGLRTHILVCTGSMLAMTVGQFAAIYYTTVDPTRIGAQVVSGLGFLGAGSIIVTRDNHVSGLTTAAGLWASACIGLALGIGFYEGALVGAAVVYFAERILKKVSKRLENRDNKDNQESKL